MATAIPRRSFPWRQRIPVSPLIALFGLTLTAFVWLEAANRQAADRAAEIVRINRENSSLALAFEEHVRRVIQSTDSALLFLKHEYESHEGVTASLSDFISRATQDPFLNQIAVIDARGDFLASALPIRPGVNISDREHFRVHAGGRDAGLFLGAPVKTRLSGKWSFYATRRLNRPDGSFAGIVSVGLDPEYFSGYYNAPELGKDRAIVLLGLDGIVRARRFQQQSEIGQDLRGSPVFEAVKRQPAGHYEVVGVIDQRRRFASYRALADFPLIVLVSDLTSSALAPYEQRAAATRRTALGFTLFVAIFCLTLIRAERRTRRQNEHLTVELGERRRAEEALRESQDLFSAFLDNTPAAVFVQDLRGQVLYANQAYKELAKREAIGRNARELLAPGAEPGSDGRPALRGRSVALDETVVDDDGTTRTFETRMFVVDRVGKEPLLGCIAVDSTGRRQAEEQRLVFERRMQQTQKLESLGVLAGGVAHDFNNLLMVILGNTELALAKTAPAAPARAFLENIDTAAQRAANLTNQMLAYSGKGHFVIEPVNLSKLVEEMGQLLGTVVAKNAVVRYRLDPALPPVLADATQIRQVVMNLITNASDAIGHDAGTITISTHAVVIEADSPVPGFLDHRLSAGTYAAVEVSDTGGGMHQATLARIFDPFFTTKNTGRGLGLASVLGIVQGHGGGIRVDSRPGQGTIFSVLLPASPDAVPAETSPAAPGPKERGATADRRLVLVVDDEESVRTTARAMLEDSGFGVVDGVDGVEGVELFRAHHAGLAVVLLDMSMPRMGGEEAFRQMQAIDPSVPVVLMSGYDETEAVGHFTGKGLAGFLRKPYRMRALIDKLREAIAAQPAPPG